MPVLIIGETVVDLVCERPVEGFEEVDELVAHVGGAAANVASRLVSLGVPAAVGGGVGDDGWGRWIRSQLAARGVGLEWFATVRGWPTPLAFVTVSSDGEPSYEFVGRGLSPVAQALDGRIEQAVEACDAFAFYSNSMVGEPERAVTLAGRRRALALGRPVIYDPNLRLSGWPNWERAAEIAAAAVPGAFLVKCNDHEARMLTGRTDVEAAAAALLARGAHNVVVTLGPDGALLRGEAQATAAGVPARTVNATGAGDAVLAVLLEALQVSKFDPAALARALPDAARQGASATEHWGALE